MNDLISRQAAIDAIKKKKDKKAKGDIGGFYNKIIQNDIDTLMALPSAQPVNYGSTKEDDSISRQDAIDALMSLTVYKSKREIVQAADKHENTWIGGVAECIDEIEDLPSAQSETLGCLNCDNFDVVKQIQWERDLAIAQLKELGYGLGEKIRTDGDIISRQEAIDSIMEEPSEERYPVYYAEKIRNLPPAQQKPLKYLGESICIYCMNCDCAGCVNEPTERV